MAIYLALAAATFIENLVPPIPSDLLAALAAFLSHSGVTSARAVFLWSWLGNLGGAIVLYALAHRFGRRFLAGRTGRRLISAEALAEMEREYLRFGVLGIFLARLLPGLRSFVAVFAGVINLGPIKAIVPIALASAVWYAGLVFVGAKLGEQWEDISRIISEMNRGLSIIAVVVVAIVTLVYLRARKRRPRELRLWNLVKAAFGERLASREPLTDDPGAAAAATLLLELSHADHEMPAEDRQAIETYLRERWDVPEIEAPEGRRWFDLERYRREIETQYERERRVQLAERLWRIALGDGSLSRQEDRLMGRAAQLLGLDAAELAAARERALGTSGRSGD